MWVTLTIIFKRSLSQFERDQLIAAIDHNGMTVIDEESVVFYRVWRLSARSILRKLSSVTESYTIE